MVLLLNAIREMRNNTVGVGEVEVFRIKFWDRWSKKDLSESMTPCHDA